MKRFLSAPYIFGGAIVVACVVVFGLAEAGWSNLSINHELDPINILTLGVNIFIAFFLQYYFAARATDDRAEKDILLDNVRDVFNILRSCRDEVIVCHGLAKVGKESQKKIIRLYRNLSNGLENLQTAIEMSGCEKLTKECESVRDNFYKYKAAATGKFPYDPSDISYQDQTYRALMRELHSLAFKVNKHR
jgi:hypothetical protein